MWKFKDEHFNFRLAEAFLSRQLEVPDENAKESLEYIQQYVVKTSGRSELIGGYIPDEYVDDLVKIRDASSVRDFGSAVEAIGCEGRTSEKVGDESDFTKVAIKSTRDNIRDIYDQYSSDKSKDVRRDIGNITDLLNDNLHKDEIFYYMPTENYKEMDWSEIEVRTC